MDDRLAHRQAALETGPTILLVDDDVELCELMREFFCRHGIRLKAVHDGSGGLARALGGGYDLLEFLVRAAGRIVSRDELMVALYQRRASPFDRAVDVHISHLRKKLGRHGALI